MNLRKVIQIALKGLSHNKLRSLLTMLGVIIGVSAVIVMISISRGTEATIEDQINSLGTNLIFIQSNFSRGGPGQGEPQGGLVYDDTFAIANQVDGVTGAVVEQNSSETVKYGNVSIDQVSVLGASLAQVLFGETPPIGQAVAVGNTKLTVVGVMAQTGLVGGVDYNSYLFTPITVVFEKFIPNQFARIFGDRVRLIYVQVDPKKKMDDVIYQIELLLARRHNVSLDSPDFVIRTQDDIIQTQESTTAAFRNLLLWVASVSLLVGGIGIMNIMLVSVTERTREIGIRQSVGATPNDIRWQFLTEALLLSLVGGLIGIFTGILGAWLFGRFGDMRTVIAPSSILLAFSSAALVGVFFGYYPANKAAQLDPIEALRHE
jgi:putative ABC transport system permease protein